jgi:hypothetical protein
LALTQEEAHAEWVREMADHETKYDMLFINFMRYSFIVLANLLLEEHLYRFCLVLKEKSPNSKDVPIPRVGSSSIGTYKKYISNELKVSVPCSIWDWTDELSYVRNCIVHASGDVNRAKHKEELTALAERNVGIHISGVEPGEMTPLYFGDNMLMIESRYCMRVLDRIEALFKEIMKITGMPSEIKSVHAE